MDKIKIWHNSRCRKSREGLKYLQDKGIEPEIFEYLKSDFDARELIEIINKTGQPLKDFIRTQEADYKALGLKGKDLTVEEFGKLASQYPKLLQRPIVIKDAKAVLARPANKIDEIL
ncbi:arsenate reductase (glutaredoxin) [candidate division KSB1 bacterium]|nr:arsenate reductase (glutaredoxin) [candidate division KSB1 bacterium]MBL7093134.1 arsenate reductase (glutaredoxin) [candidate division KSB1 bacterium]